MIRWLWAALAAGFVVAGAVVLRASSGPDDFGWFAYTPGDRGDMFSGDALLLARGELVGAVLVVAGLLVAAAVVGFVLGARRASRRG